MKIKSIVNVITNSSTEVFLIKRDDTFFELLKTFNVNPDTFKFIESEDEIKKILLKGIASKKEGKWCDEYDDFGELLNMVLDSNYNPFYCSYSCENDICDSVIWRVMKNELGKTDEEIIDFFMPLFAKTIGYCSYSYCSEGMSNPDEETLNTLGMIYKGGYECFSD